MGTMVVRVQWARLKVAARNPRVFDHHFPVEHDAFKQLVASLQSEFFDIGIMLKKRIRHATTLG